MRVENEILFRYFEIPYNILPEIRPSSQKYFSIHISPSSDISLCNNDHNCNSVCVPISGCLGDQQAALVGQGCIKSGMAKNT